MHTGPPQHCTTLSNVNAHSNLHEISDYGKQVNVSECTVSRLHTSESCVSPFVAAIVQFGMCGVVLYLLRGTVKQIHVVSQRRRVT